MRAIGPSVGSGRREEVRLGLAVGKLGPALFPRKRLFRVLVYLMLECMIFGWPELWK
jgi:hypothetical protein